MVNNRAIRYALLAMIVFCLASLGFLAIAKEVRDNETQNFDSSVLLAIHQLSGPKLDSLMSAITQLGGVLFVPIATALGALLLWAKRRKVQAIKLALGVGGATVINLFLKNYFERQRPQLWDRLIVEHTFAFPSGHAMASGALAASIVLILWKTKYRKIAVILGSIYVAVIGFSRLYLGVHYPSDIIAGWCVSVAWVLLVALLFNTAKIKLKD